MGTIGQQVAGASVGASPDLTRQMFEALFELQEAILPAVDVESDARTLLDVIWPPESIDRLEPRIAALVESLLQSSQVRLACGIIAPWEHVAAAFGSAQTSSEL